MAHQRVDIAAVFRKQADADARHGTQREIADPVWHRQLLQQM